MENDNFNNPLKDHFGFYMRRVNSSKVMPRKDINHNLNFRSENKDKNSTIENVISYLNFITTKINDLDFKLNLLKKELNQFVENSKIKNDDSKQLINNTIENIKKIKNKPINNNEEDNLKESVANSKEDLASFLKKYF